MLLDEQLEPEERMVRETAYAYAQEKLLPRVTESFRHERSDPEIFREMREPHATNSATKAMWNGWRLSHRAQRTEMTSMRKAWEKSFQLWQPAPRKK